MIKVYHNAKNQYLVKKELKFKSVLVFHKIINIAMKCKEIAFKSLAIINFVKKTNKIRKNAKKNVMKSVISKNAKIFVIINKKIAIIIVEEIAVALA